MPIELCLGACVLPDVCDVYNEASRGLYLSIGCFVERVGC